MATDSALATLNRAWMTLSPLGYPMAVMGGIALAAWNYIRATRDVDLLIAINQSEQSSVLAALYLQGVRPKKTPPTITVGDLHFVQLLYTPPDEFYDVQLDLLLAESAFQRSAIARRVRRSVPGIDLPLDVVNCDDLILLKLVAGRMIDLADAAMLLRENRDVIDLHYLDEWLKRLDLTAQFRTVWSEAFPGTSPPPSPRSSLGE